MTRKLVLDCDTGTDDAVAIMLAALHPALGLLGVTTVNGNVEVAQCTDNTLRTLDWIGRGDIPVYEGLATPIVRKRFPNAPRQQTRSESSSRHSAYAGAEIDQAAPARAAISRADFRREPRRNRAGRGGTAVQSRRRDRARSRFSGQCRRAHHHGRRHRQVQRDARRPSSTSGPIRRPRRWCSTPRFRRSRWCRSTPRIRRWSRSINAGFCAALGSHAGKATADLVEFRISGYEANQPTGVPQTAPVHDAVCIAALVDPQVIDTKFLNVVVETRGEYTIGRTVVDHEKRTTRPPNCHVALGADRARFFDMLMTTFAKRGG